MQCPYCGAELTEILACYNYAIEYSEEQERWVKSIGSVVYSCSNCTDELDTHQIEDVLRQVDEL